MKNEVGCFSLSLSFPEELGFWVACHAKRRCHLLMISVVAEFTKLSVHGNCVRVSFWDSHFLFPMLLLILTIKPLLHKI